MAKSFNLNPGADATIVQAATRAGLASYGVGDYSEMFQAQADSYAKTMQATSAMWSNLISVAGQMVAPMVQKAGERMRSDMDVRSSAQSEGLVGQLDSWKNEIKNTWRSTVDAEDMLSEDEWIEANKDVVGGGTYEDYVKENQIKNNPLSRENIAKRRKINKERDAFFNAIKENEAIITANDEILSSEDFDAKAMGPYKLEIIDAFQGSLTTGEKTDRGNYFVTSYDKKTKKLVHTLHHDPEAMKDDVEPLLTTEETTLPTEAGPVMGSDGKAITYTDRQIKQYMVPADPDLEVNLTKVFDQFMDDGYKAGIEWGDFQSSRAQKAIGALIKKQGLDRAMQLTWGSIDKSFYEELTSESGLSAELWSALQNTHGLDETTLKNTGILKNIDGTSDGVAGIQESDFLKGDNAAANMMILQEALLNPGSGNYASREVREKIFLEWAAGDNGKIKESWDYGKRLNKDWIKANKGDGNGGDGGNGDNDGKGTYFGKGGTRMNNIIAGGDKNVWLDNSTKNVFNNVKLQVNKRGDFGDYTWDEENKTYMKGDLIIPDKQALWENHILKNDDNPDGQNLAENFMLDPFWTEIKDWDGTQHPNWQSQLDNTKIETKTENETSTQQEGAVNNNKPAIKGVAYPPRNITNKAATKTTTAALNKLYEKFGVIFTPIGTGGTMMMTHVESNTTQTVEMNRFNDRNNMESQDIIQQFVLQYAK